MFQYYKSGDRKIFKQVLIILIIAVFVYLIYFFFFSAAKCTSDECYNEKMASCDKATYINEEPEASWKYKIKGKEKEACVIEVTLLNAKQGQLGIDKLQGRSMDCYYPLEVVDFPEKNLELCHGRLKEDIQEIIIQDLHKYIIGNIGQISEEISAF
jgi:hypothetical protein